MRSIFNVSGIVSEIEVDLMQCLVVSKYSGDKRPVTFQFFEAFGKMLWEVSIHSLSNTITFPFHCPCAEQETEEAGLGKGKERLSSVPK